MLSWQTAFTQSSKPHLAEQVQVDMLQDDVGPQSWARAFQRGPVWVLTELVKGVRSNMIAKVPQGWVARGSRKDPLQHLPGACIGPVQQQSVCCWSSVAKGTYLQPWPGPAAAAEGFGLHCGDLLHLKTGSPHRSSPLLTLIGRMKQS